MRNTFSAAIEKLGFKDESVVFITGDLGYKALENVRAALKDRFINAGVAEQHMIGLAAGLAKQGMKVFCYSIAPFVVYRCLEQTRNDVCLHNLPVFLVGNGGGYGYGIMGPTHHALEDIATLSCLPNMVCYIPAFDNEVPFCLEQIIKRNRPAYLRLGVGAIKEKAGYPDELNVYHLHPNARLTVLVLGPAINYALSSGVSEAKTDLFYVARMPLSSLPESFIQSVAKTKNLLVIEEHTERGGLGEHIACLLLKQKSGPFNIQFLNTKGYPNGLYGSQSYHLEQSGMGQSQLKEIWKTYF